MATRTTSLRMPGAWATPDEPPWNARIHAGSAHHDRRSGYEVDRDRIVHSGTFRELQHKTQVQSIVHSPTDLGISFRTRLNHVIEVAQLARGLAREIGADEGLSEAIALAHDLGHPPFGHAGERALGIALAQHGAQGWNANVHSLAVVDDVELAFAGFRGLNLTWATREGIARHSTPFDEPVTVGEFTETRFGGVECQIVDAADVLAYIAHDLDDALAGGFIELGEIAPLSTLLADLITDATQAWNAKGQYVWPPPDAPVIVRRRVVAKLISQIITDLATTASERLARHQIESAAAARHAPERLVALSSQYNMMTQQLLALLTTRYYRSDVVRAADDRAAQLVQDVFEALVTDPGQIPERFRPDLDAVEAAATYLASLNDRSAVVLAQRLGVDLSGSATK